MPSTSTLRPGFIVSLKTSVRGNVRYIKTDLDTSKTETGASKATWQTERLIEDAAEHEAAGKARTKARAAIVRVCTTTAFGLLCPENAAENLDKAIAEARAVADAFNSNARHSRLSVYVLTGKIAQDDVEALKAINSEVSDMMTAMEKGLKELDIKAIREAASNARAMGAMLTQDAQVKVQIAVETARDAAKRLVQAKEDGTAEVDVVAIRKITELRGAFLDLGGGKEIGAPEIKAPLLDLAPAAE